MKKIIIFLSKLKTVIKSLKIGEITMADIFTITDKEISLYIDYSLTLQEMFNIGKYVWKDSNITEKNFPLPAELKGKKVFVSTKLFNFNSKIRSEDVIHEMDKAGYRPATLAELLALGEANPKLQKKFPIVALGSVWRDERGDDHVPVFEFAGIRRRFGLALFDFGWCNYCHFLAVRK